MNLELKNPKTLRTTRYTLRDFLRQIDLNNPKLKKIEAMLYGNFQSSKIGTGFDFNEIREYKIGDDLRHISWSATAKTGTLHTREYFAEKEVNSFFLIDISNSMFCGNKSESFIQLLAFLLNIVCNFSEKIGGVFFSDEIKYHFPLGQPRIQSNIMFQTLIGFYNNLVTLVKEETDKVKTTNLFKALEFTKRYFVKKGMIFIISDFINLTSWEKLIFETGQKQNIYSFQIYDPIDFNLPKTGYITIIDPETKELCTVNTDSKIIQETYYKFMIQNEEKLKRFLKSIGVNHMIIEKNDFN